MAKFTVFFKDKPIYTNIYDTGVVHIGRDETNQLIVDSLAVAPAHAVVIIKPEVCVIKQLNEKFPLLINHQAVKEAVLQSNDVINVGKHSIVFTLTEAVMDTPVPAPMFKPKQDEDVKALNERLEQLGKQPEANLQIIDGPHIGRILSLKKAMTRLGHDGASVVAIVRRKDGYYISALQGSDGVTVNQQALGDNTLLLKVNDVIDIDGTPMQFFTE